MGGREGERKTGSALGREGRFISACGYEHAGEGWHAGESEMCRVMQVHQSDM